MTDNSTITAAIAEMGVLLRDGFSVEEVFAEIKEAFGVHPQLAARKFEEAYAATPEAYAAAAARAPARTFQTKAAIREEQLAAAKIIGEAYFFAKFRHDGSTPDVFGKTLAVRGEEVMVICYVAGRPKWNSIGVCLSTGGICRLSLPASTRATLNA